MFATDSKSHKITLLKLLGPGGAHIKAMKIIMEDFKGSPSEVQDTIWVQQDVWSNWTQSECQLWKLVLSWVYRHLFWCALPPTAGFTSHYNNMPVSQCQFFELPQCFTFRIIVWFMQQRGKTSDWSIFAGKPPLINQWQGYKTWENNVLLFWFAVVRKMLTKSCLVLNRIRVQT